MFIEKKFLYDLCTYILTVVTKYLIVMTVKIFLFDLFLFHGSSDGTSKDVMTEGHVLGFIS